MNVVLLVAEDSGGLLANITNISDDHANLQNVVVFPNLNLYPSVLHECVKVLFLCLQLYCLLILECTVLYEKYRKRDQSTISIPMKSFYFLIN